MTHRGLNLFLAATYLVAFLILLIDLLVLKS
jgi:hypothetical protein